MSILAENLTKWNNAELIHAYRNVRSGSDYGKALKIEMDKRNI